MYRPFYLMLQPGFCLLLLLAGCSMHDHSNTHADMCEVDARTAFGKKLLAEAERISEKQTICVFTDCRELEDLNAGKKNNLTSWGYDLPMGATT